MSKSLARALERRTSAERDVQDILKRDYPPGRSLAWKRNGLHDGVVLQNGYGDRIKVQNSRTNRELWIYAYCIVEAMA
jgi:hypothetical protein